jgi:hypothetical protein
VRIPKRQKSKGLRSSEWGLVSLCKLLTLNVAHYDSPIVTTEIVDMDEKSHAGMM